MSDLSKDEIKDAAISEANYVWQCKICDWYEDIDDARYYVDEFIKALKESSVKASKSDKCDG